MNRDDLVIKITNYKGSVTHSWRVPKSRRACKSQIIKLLRLYERCKQSRLLTRDLLKAIKFYAEALYRLAVDVFIVNPELVSLLHEVMNVKVEEYEEEIVIEKMREHTSAVCSLCNCKLKYPAYVVYRKGSQIVKESAPVGIFCLNYLHGKLNNCATQIISKISNIPIETTPHVASGSQYKLF